MSTQGTITAQLEDGRFGCVEICTYAHQIIEILNSTYAEKGRAARLIELGAIRSLSKNKVLAIHRDFGLPRVVGYGDTARAALRDLYDRDILTNFDFGLFHNYLLVDGQWKSNWLNGRPLDWAIEVEDVSVFDFIRLGVLRKVRNRRRVRKLIKRGDEVVWSDLADVHLWEPRVLNDVQQAFKVFSNPTSSHIDKTAAIMKMVMEDLDSHNFY